MRHAPVGAVSRFGTFLSILFPDHGNNIAFAVENYPHFHATMVHSRESRAIVDYLGTHQHPATDLVLDVLDDGSRGVYTIQMQVRNPYFAFLFGCKGEFTCEFPAVVGDAVPVHLKPVREEVRD